jgi:gluconate/galactonate dehydratase
MRISRVVTAVVEANFDWTYVRVETDEGVSGLGECFFAPGLSAMIREFESILVGEDPRDIDRLYQKMRWASSAGSIAGFTYHAISGIEAALWDLKGRALGVPIWQLMGGKFRDRVRIYADCHAGHTLESLGPLLQRRSPEWLTALSGEQAVRAAGYYEALPDDYESFTPKAYAAKAVAVRDAGYSALKFDLDVPVEGTAAPDPYARTLSPAQLEHLAALVSETCAAVGRHVEVAFDCHWRFTLKDALKLAKMIEGVPVAWLEDPTPPENPTTLARLTAATSTPIGCGENWYTRDGFREALATGAIDVALPDFQKCGGLGEGKRIADLVDMHDLPVSPHNISSPIGTMASVHVAAAIPNFHTLEFHAQDVPFFDALLAGGCPLIVDGHVAVPDGPGLGVELDLEVAATYAKPGERFFD